MYYHFNNMIEAYRKRVLEKNEEYKALKTINEFSKFWDKKKKEKWYNLIKPYIDEKS